MPLPEQREQALLTHEFPGDAWALLASRLSDQRQARMQAVAARRTRRIRLVVQDIHHPHNVSACLRSAEAFGVQDVDIVTLKESFRASTVAKGVANWLTLRKHHTIKACVNELRAAGYLIAAGVPRADARPLHELPADQKLAVVFGNEHAGIHPEWLEHVDTPFTIPMSGFVESLNISVCAAVSLSHLTRAARAKLGPEAYHLSPEEQEKLLSTWVCRQIPSWSSELARLRP